ncbi:MAG: AmmeMemoRadiSam system radical SAM enzyme [Anaerolineaceae bacterium]
MLYDALLYNQLDDHQVQCNLCSHKCKIKEGDRGICRVRENRGGQLFTHVYGNLIARNIDPIEKKPLYHFYPGSRSYSIAMPGCNFRCDWCQNWQISQMPKIMELPHAQRIMPEVIVEDALASGCLSISYTYTEPTIFFEYCFDAAKLARAKGLFNVFVTNGFMTTEMLETMHPHLDAANVDIKAFRDQTYRKYMGGRLEPVLESCRKMRSLGIWLEITTLIVPGVNDDPEELEAIARFIYEDLGSETPWHLSRFYPQYKLSNISATDKNILYQTKEMVEKIGLLYVYIGNVGGSESTKCKTCGQELIQRNAFSVHLPGLNRAGRCKNCNTVLDGVGLVQEP